MTGKKFKQFKIELEDDRFVFYPGEELRGKLVMDLDREMKMNYIKISVKGKVETEWKKTVYQDQEQEIIKYETEKKIFDKEEKVYGNGQKEPHPEGYYEYPFSFQLPSDLPNSIEGRHGYVRYKLQAKIDKPWKKDLKIKKMFCVNSRLDANADRPGPGDNKETTLGCCCCETGPVTMSVNMDRSVYCPGENILLTAQVVNNTNREIDGLIAELMRTTRFVAKKEGDGTEDDMVEDICISKVKSKDINEGETLNWEGEKLSIPATFLTCNSNKWITVNYYVKVWLDIPMAFDLVVRLPIELGSVPNFHAFQQLPVDPEEDREHCGLAPMAMLGRPEMCPFIYKPSYDGNVVKLSKNNESDEFYQDKKYMAVYSFARPDPNFRQLEPDSDPNTVAVGASQIENPLPPIE